MRARSLKTPRLSIDPATSDDAPFIDRLLADPAVRAYLGGPVALQDRSAAIMRYLANHVWVVRQGTRPLGLLFLGKHVDCGDREISYMFAQEAWGHGFAFEALSALRAATSGPLVAETQAANTASIRLLKRLGFREVARVDRFGAQQVLFRDDQKRPREWRGLWV